MVLVPEVLLNELKGKLPKPPEFQSTLSIGQELDQITRREDLTPEEKVALYGQELHRYRNYLQQAREPTTIKKTPAPVAPAAAAAAAAPAPAAAAPPAAPDPEMDQQIIQSVNKPMQRKAELLLNHLKKTNVLTWDKDGEISYRGQKVPDSNIVDIMAENMRTRSLKNRPVPKGLDEFAQALKETRTPMVYLQNRDLIKAMQKPGKISTPKGALSDEDEEEESGFHDASSSSFLTPISRPVEARSRVLKQFTPKYSPYRASKQLKDQEEKKKLEQIEENWLHLPKK